ncbi:MAG: SDR family oxidoreductase [Pseudomonadales bacterium]
MGANILMVGCGDIGISLGVKLVAIGNQVWGLRRDTSRLPATITPVTADVTELETLVQLSSLTLDYVVVSLIPASVTDEGYRKTFVEGLDNLLKILVDSRSLKRLFFISSTSVYHQTDGQWVDENSETNPDGFSGQRLLESEQLLASSGLPYTVVRFAGIYGPGRQRLIEQVLAKQNCAEEPILYTNRIHIDDCVGFLAHLIGLHQQGQVLESRYIGVDNEPVSLWALMRWLAQQLGIDPVAMTVTAQTRRGNKRCSNRRLLATGYQLQYASYQQGYGKLLASQA